MTAKVKKDKIKLEKTLPVRDFLSGKELRSIDLDEKIFDAKVNKPLLHQVVVMYQAAKRAGTASTKTRGEVSGGGKKPWKQKGTAAQGWEVQEIRYGRAEGLHSARILRIIRIAFPKR